MERNDLEGTRGSQGLPTHDFLTGLATSRGWPCGRESTSPRRRAGVFKGVIHLTTHHPAVLTQTDLIGRANRPAQDRMSAGARVGAGLTQASAGRGAAFGTPAATRLASSLAARLVHLERFFRVLDSQLALAFSKARGAGVRLSRPALSHLHRLLGRLHGPGPSRDGSARARPGSPRELLEASASALSRNLPGDFVYLRLRATGEGHFPRPTGRLGSSRA